MDGCVGSYWEVDMDRARRAALPETEWCENEVFILALTVSVLT